MLTDLLIVSHAATIFTMSYTMIINVLLLWIWMRTRWLIFYRGTLRTCPYYQFNDE